MSESKKYNVTYLLGAGASANALPTVKKTGTSIGLARDKNNAAAFAGVMQP